MDKVTELESKARIFAVAAHAAVKQLRKYTNDPYIVHPAEVVEIIKGVPGHTEEMVAAGWMHDVPEDTGVSVNIIYLTFGNTVGDYVYGLTEKFTKEAYPDLNRAARKALECERLAEESAAVHTIKLADIFSNVKSISEHDPDFAKVYVPEKRLQVAVLTKGDPTLLKRVTDLINSLPY